ncbi:hypothetical protein NBRC3293_0740 [Gluconobacter oxydans NBRC 3293]|uniref:Uncharacterized protein n=1 Tax=Gluconobacter oxydans NBRC 3293 TaxID=1315969 RepID=A0A829WSU2_GLUOY|nr:hypothetical protein NBRC3293_0740 [Gluconobacter oxydans NBRC 3293]
MFLDRGRSGIMKKLLHISLPGFLHTGSGSDPFSPEGHTTKKCRFQPVFSGRTHLISHENRLHLHR